jgi:hypothetical protein
VDTYLDAGEGDMSIAAFFFPCAYNSCDVVVKVQQQVMQQDQCDMCCAREATASQSYLSSSACCS